MPLGETELSADDLKRFWSKVEKTEGCWIWNGSIDKGYGKFSVTTARGIYKTRAAYRISYGVLKKDIPNGLTIDHLCRNKRCVNPEHLEAVTMKVNCLRGIGISAINARKKFCIRGHPLSGKNLYIQPSAPTSRYCRMCKRLFNLKDWRNRVDEAIIERKEREGKL